MTARGEHQAGRSDTVSITREEAEFIARTEIDSDVRIGLKYPAEAPTVRAHFRRLWQPGELFDYATVRFQGETGNERPGPSELDERFWNAAALAAGERRRLERATLWWVSAEMLPVLLAAAAGVPDEATAAEVEPLSPSGLVFFEEPWRGTSSTPGQPDVEVSAFTWGPATMPLAAVGSEQRQAAIAVSSYVCYVPADVAVASYPSSYVCGGGLWAPLGRSDWPLVDRLDSPPWEMPDQSFQSFVEDRRIWAALMTLLAHDGIATTSKQVAPRGDRRRHERANDPFYDPTYRVVTLRHQRNGTDYGREAIPPRARDHRWIVEGHWRRQPYGPGRRLRRLQWINPYVKGPEDKPIREKEVIHAWRR